MVETPPRRAALTAMQTVACARSSVVVTATAMNRDGAPPLRRPSFAPPRRVQQPRSGFPEPVDAAATMRQACGRVVPTATTLARRPPRLQPSALPACWAVSSHVRLPASLPPSSPSMLDTVTFRKSNSFWDTQGSDNVKVRYALMGARRRRRRRLCGGGCRHRRVGGARASHCSALPAPQTGPVCFEHAGRSGGCAMQRRARQSATHRREPWLSRILVPSHASVGHCHSHPALPAVAATPLLSSRTLPRCRA